MNGSRLNNGIVLTTFWGRKRFPTRVGRAAPQKGYRQTQRTQFLSAVPARAAPAETAAPAPAAPAERSALPAQPALS